jgi:hypothetical protein
VRHGCRVPGFFSAAPFARRRWAARRWEGSDPAKILLTRGSHPAVRSEGGVGFITRIAPDFRRAGVAQRGGDASVFCMGVIPVDRVDAEPRASSTPTVWLSNRLSRPTFGARRKRERGARKGCAKGGSWTRVDCGLYFGSVGAQARALPDPPTHQALKRVRVRCGG